MTPRDFSFADPWAFVYIGLALGRHPSSEELASELRRAGVPDDLRDYVADRLAQAPKPDRRRRAWRERSSDEEIREIYQHRLEVCRDLRNRYKRHLDQGRNALQLLADDCCVPVDEIRRLVLVMPSEAAILMTADILNAPADSVRKIVSARIS